MKINLHSNPSKKFINYFSDIITYIFEKVFINLSCYNLLKGVDNMKQKYSDEEKQKIIDRYIFGKESSASILADTGIPKSTFYNWLKVYREEQINSKRKPINIRNFHLLENKVVRLEGIIEILKTADCTSQTSLKQRLYAAEQLHGKYSVHMICEALDIPRGTFYNHILRNKKDNTWYAKRREELRIRIREIFDENNQIFGAEKIAAVMRNEGIHVTNGMVRELMRDMGIGSIRQMAKKLYEEENRKHKNYLNQEFDPKSPNEVWVSDVTYFKFNNESLYICVIIDLYARLVIGYKIGKKNSTQLVKSTFQQAYLKRQSPVNLLYHTDRGFNYTSKTMADYLKDLNVIHSFSRPYVPYDNSVMESFFSSLKREELYRTKYKSEKDFRNAVDKYIIFYNTKRPHKKLQYKTPEQKEQEYVLKQTDKSSVNK